MWSRYPFAAQTRASEVPVLPPVYSTTVSPGFSRPSSSALEITASAIRSFTLPLGFSHSSFTRISAQSGGTTFRSRTIDVFPIARRMSMDPVDVTSWEAASAGKSTHFPAGGKSLRNTPGEAPR